MVMHLVGLEHVREPLARLRRQHLLRDSAARRCRSRSSRRARRCSRRSGRSCCRTPTGRDTARVPAAQVVVHGDARIPLRRLKQRVGPALRHAVARAGSAGQLVVPLDLERRRRMRRELRRELHLSATSSRRFRIVGWLGTCAACAAAAACAARAPSTPAAAAAGRDSPRCR